MSDGANIDTLAVVARVEDDAVGTRRAWTPLDKAFHIYSDRRSLPPV